MMQQKKTILHDKEEFRMRLRRLKEAVDAEQLLRHLGFKITRVTPKEVRAQCKIHGGDNKTSFRMNRQTKTWTCYSHNCHEDIGYDVISLVQYMMSTDFKGAVSYLENITGLSVNDELDYVRYKREQDRMEFIRNQGDNRIVPPALVSEDYLKSFKKFRSPYFEQEENGGFEKELLDEFEIGGGYVDRYGFQRDVIPIRDKDGNLVSYSFRDITGKADEDYKYILTKGFDKDKVLYNLFRAADNMGQQRALIIVEGFKSVWRLQQAGYKNAVACMGSHITTGQQQLIYSTAFEIVTIFDADQAGIKGTKSALKDMSQDIKVIPIFLPHTGKDPSDYTVSELREILGGLNG